MCVSCALQVLLYQSMEHRHSLGFLASAASTEEGGGGAACAQPPSAADYAITQHLILGITTARGRQDLQQLGNNRPLILDSTFNTNNYKVRLKHDHLAWCMAQRPATNGHGAERRCRAAPCIMNS
jgi:hypothetical protein